MAKKLTLTGDDLARADLGIVHAINWWKTRGRSKYVRNEIAKLEATLSKLNDINNYAYPFRSGYSEVVELPDYGSEQIMCLNAPGCLISRKKAARYNKKCPAL